MTPEEYKSKYEAIDKQIDSLKNEQKEMKAAFIADHKKFDEGDKVKITTPDGRSVEGFVYGINCLYGKMSYYFLKVKKDGKPSTNKLYIHGYYYGDDLTIELIEKWPEETAPENQQTT